MKISIVGVNEIMDSEYITEILELFHVFSTVSLINLGGSNYFDQIVSRWADKNNIEVWYCDQGSATWNDVEEIFMFTNGGEHDYELPVGKTVHVCDYAKSPRAVQQMGQQSLF